jgi:hypothetical protein
MNGGSMKKMIVSLMLIISMFAFAAESAPSATVGYVKYSNVVTAGTDLNHIAIPVTNGWTSSSNIDPTSLYYNSIQKWNPVTQLNVISSRVGLTWLTPFAIVPGDHLTLNAKVNHDLIVNGTVNDIPAYNLIVTAGTDLNHFMMPLTKSNLTTSTLLGTDISTCNSIQRWNASTQLMQISSKVGLTWLTPYAVAIADPLVVNMTAAKTWPTSKVYEDVANDEAAPAPKGLGRQIFFGVADKDGNTYDFSSAPYDGVTMLAWIRARPAETQTTELTDFGAGMTISIGYYDVGAFATPWLPGDVLVTRFEDTVAGLAKEYEYILDNSTDPIAVGVDTMLGAGSSTVATTTPLLLDIPSSIEDGVVPAETKLHQNYPNPFNPTTTIKFDLASNSVVKLNVYNYNGQLVKSLVNGQMNAGYHSVNFDASSLSAGVYYYTMVSANKTMTQKMVLVK